MNVDLIEHLEACERRGKWAKSWERRKLHPTQILHRAIEDALIQTERTDVGEVAGENVMALCAERGIYSHRQNLYDIGCHHACLADILATYLRTQISGPVRRPDGISTGGYSWEPKCLSVGPGLARIVLVDRWDDERREAEVQSWRTLGEMAVYDASVKLYVVVLGASSGGKRHSPWTKGFLHPRSRQLRFQRRTKSVRTPLGENWITAWREDYSQITRGMWIDAMREDGCLEESFSLYTVMPAPEHRLKEIRSVIQRKQERLESLKGVPDPSFSGCHLIGKACPFQECCLGKELRVPEGSDFL